MGKNRYAKVIQDEISSYRSVERDIQVQYMFDMFSIVLNDPDVMGKSVLGKDRLAKILKSVGKMYDDNYDALLPGVAPEADFCQQKIDDKLKKIFKEKFSPFDKRYPALAKEKY